MRRKPKPTSSCDDRPPMIQRIQSLYLAIVAVLCLTSLFATMGRYVDGSGVVATFTNFGFAASAAPYAGVESAGPWALGALLGTVAALSLVSVMLFRTRMRQMRLVLFSTILLVGYLLTYAFFAWLYQGMLEEAAPGAGVRFQLCATMAYPVIGVILNCLAIHGIRKDEALVRSLDRIR